MICFICKMSYTSSGMLLNHLKKSHDLKSNSAFFCAEETCGIKFNSLLTFKRHLKRKHAPGNSIESTPFINDKPPNENKMNRLQKNDSLNIPTKETDKVSETQVDIPISPPSPQPSFFKQSALNFITSLANQNNLPGSVALDIQRNVNKCVIGPLMDKLQQFAEKRLKNNEDVFNEMTDIMQSCRNALDDFTPESRIEIENNEMPVDENPLKPTSELSEIKMEIEHNDTLNPLNIMPCNGSPFDEEDELFNLLKAWKMEHLYQYFTDQGVTVEVLQIVKVRHLERLLRDFDFGTQIYFEHYLQQWRESIGLPLPDMCQQSSFSHEVKGPALNLPCQPSSPSISKPSTACSTPEREVEGGNKIKLATILNVMAKGRKLVEYYNISKGFEEEHRSTLIRIIADYFDMHNIALTLPASYVLEQEIIERFPTEKLEFYRTSKRGRIYNRYSNIKYASKHLNKTLKVIEETGDGRDDLSTVFVPEDDAEEKIKAIKNGNVSSAEFDRSWGACIKYRLNEIINSTSIKEILQKWPEYNFPSGCRLIDIDFAVLFPNSQSIFNTWDLNQNKLKDVLTTKNLLSSKTFKEPLKEFDKLSQNSKEALLLWATHGCLVPWQKVVSTDVDGKKQITRYTIKDSQNSFILLHPTLEALEEDLRLKMSQESNIQPCLMVVGNDFKNISHIYVYFNGEKIPLKNIIRGVDVCFKIFRLFNLDYPKACTRFWTFIQKYFYKIKTKDNFSKVNILCNALDNI